jgi:hypothetical protein
MERLELVGPLAVPALRRALSNQKFTQVRDRIDYLLGRAERAIPAGSLLQAIRAVEVLERIATPPARAVLAELATGHPDAAITHEAAQSYRRLEQKK